MCRVKVGDVYTIYGLGEARLVISQDKDNEDMFTAFRLDSGVVAEQTHSANDNRIVLLTGKSLHTALRAKGLC